VKDLDKFNKVMKLELIKSLQRLVQA